MHLWLRIRTAKQNSMLAWAVEGLSVVGFFAGMLKTDFSEHFSNLYEQG